MPASNLSHAEKGAFSDTPAYVAMPFFMIRAAALPVDVVENLLEQFSAGYETPESVAIAAEELWSKPIVRAAVEVASSDLSSAMNKFNELSERDRDRAARSLLRYANRMSSRSTPFGLMAGVTSGSFSSDAQSCVTLRTEDDGGVIAGTRARPDMGMVLQLLRNSVEGNATAGELLVRTNDLAHVGRGRIWLENTDAYGDITKRSMSIRYTPAVETVLREARKSVTLNELHEILSSAYPQATEDSVKRVIQQLIDLNLLISAHRPRLIHDEGYDPFGDLPSHLLSDNLQCELKELSTRIDICNRTSGISEVLPLLAAGERAAAAAGHDKSAVQFDARLGVQGDSILPKIVAELAEEAANTLAIVGSDSRYPFRLSEWASVFTDSYGIGAEVPLLEVLSEETGIGVPNGYSNPRRSFPLETGLQQDRWEARESLSVQLISHALASRSLEIDLDEGWLTAFARAGNMTDESRSVVPVLDLYMELSAGASEDGWTAVVTELGQGRGGRTFARFYDLLGKEAHEKLQSLAATEQERSGQALIVELAYLPMVGRALNVALRPRTRTFELPVNVTASASADSTLSLADISVGVRRGRLYLWSRSLNREIHVAQTTMLSTATSPNVCRFLLEVSGAAFRPYAFDWGATGSAASFLPRLRRGRVIIRRASWQLRAKDLDPDLSDADFRDALKRWGEKWMLPTLVHLVEGDNHLLLDLNSSLSLFELRRALRAAQVAKVPTAVRLVEAEPKPSAGFLRDQHNAVYAAEVVVPVYASEPRPIPAARQSARRRPISVAERSHPPGGEWLYLKLYSESDAQDLILRDHLPSLIERVCSGCSAERPFFLRYADPAPHLRFRFRIASPEAQAEAFAETARWAHGLIEQGTAIDAEFATYRREIERYGGPDLIEDAELLFSTDSAATVAIMGYLDRAGEEELRREAVAALTLERIARTLVPELSERIALARTITQSDSGSAEYRSVATDLWRHHRLGGATAPLLRNVSSIWDSPGERFRGLLADADRRDGLWNDPNEVVLALLHMHCNRLGLRQDREAVACGIWRRLLDREVAMARKEQTYS